MYTRDVNELIITAYYRAHVVCLLQHYQQESPADADKPARRGSMQKLLQFDVFRFISPNSISPNFKLPVHVVTR